MKDTHQSAPTKTAVKMGGLILLFSMAGTTLAASEPASQVQLAHAYGNLPLRFEPNQGQTAPQVRFLARGPGYSLFLTAKEAVLVLQKPTAKEDSREAKTTEATGAVLHMILKGANLKASIAGQAPLPGKVNYLRGKDPKQWHTHIPTYAQVKYNQIYPGIDLIYYGRQHQLEYDFIIEPGADPKAIHLAFTGEKEIRLEDGQLVLATVAGEIRLRKPVLYQKIEGEKHLITGGYVRQGPHQVGFQVGSYDTAYPLVIDPVLSYSTYLGGSSGDSGTAIAVDWRGQAYVTGSTGSDNFPTIQNVSQPSHGDNWDIFVAKLNRAGDTLVYSTYLGGSDDDEGLDIAVDLRGQAYVTGLTRSEDDFPTTRNALQPTFGGGMYDLPRDAFVAKLNRSGDALVYSSYLGGSSGDGGSSIAVDPRGQAYVTGQTRSDDFPITQNALQPSRDDYWDAFVAKLTAKGDALMYSTYLGGGSGDYGSSIAVDPRGQAYVTGITYSTDFPTHNALQPTFGGGVDVFVTKLSRAGNALVYSTYLGGNNHDTGIGIAVNHRGQAYVIGTTGSSNFPTHNALQPTFNHGAYDTFVAKLNRAGNALVYSTYLGGSEPERGIDVAVDLRSQAYVIGWTHSDDFPITQNAVQPSHGGSYWDTYVAKLNRAGNALVYSTYLGGGGGDFGSGIAVDFRGQAYVTGYTGSDDFPTHNALQPTMGGVYDAFVAKLSSRELHPRHANADRDDDDDWDGDEDDDDDDRDDGDDD